METLGLLAMPVFVLTSGLVGTRLVLLSFRTREIPELAMGLSFLLAGFLGVGFSVAPAFLPDLNPLLAMTSSILGLIFGASGYAALATFVWRVFRPTGIAGRLVYLGSLSALVAGVVLQIALAAPGGGQGDLGRWVLNLGCVGIYGWATGESCYYATLLRRRAALGLASRDVARRVVYWAITTGSVFLIFIRQSWIMANPGSSGTGTFAFIASMGFVSAAATWLAFFPPGSRRLERHPKGPEPIPTA